MLRSWANKNKASIFDGFGKIGILGQKTITRMNGISTSQFGCGQNSRHIQVALTGWTWPNTHSFIDKTEMHGIGIGLRVDTHSSDTQSFTGAGDPQCNFATVGNEDFLQHVQGSSFSKGQVSHRAVITAQQHGSD